MTTQDEFADSIRTLHYSGNATARADAAKYLGDFAAPEAFDALWQHRSDGVDKVRRAVVKALSNFKRPEVISFLSQCLHDGDEFVRRNALQALATWPESEELTSQEMIANIIQVLQDSSYEVRIAALLLARRFKDPLLLDFMKNYFLQLGRGKIDRLRSAQYYVDEGTRHHYTISKPKMDEMGDQEFRVVSATYAAIAGKELVLHLARQESEVYERQEQESQIAKRRAALEAWKSRVANYHDRIQLALENLRKPVAGESGGVGLSPSDHREEALRELGAAYFDYFILPWLVRDLRESDYIEGRVAQIQLGAMGTLTVNYEASFFRDTWLDISPRLYWRFRNLEGASVIKAIVDVMLSDPYWRRRWYAAAILRRLKDETALPALERALKDSEADVRDEAQDALREIAGGVIVELHGHEKRLAGESRISEARRLPSSKERTWRKKKKSPIRTAIAYFLGGIILTVFAIVGVVLVLGPGPHVRIVNYGGILGSFVLGYWGYSKTKKEQEAVAPIVPNVEQLLQDLQAKGLFRRQTAIEELSKLAIRDERVISALRSAATSDSDKNVRRAAREALRALVGVPLQFVLVCGQANEVSPTYERAELQLVERVVAEHKSHMANTQLKTMRGATLPDPASEAGIEGFVRVLQTNLGIGLLDYEAEFHEQSGYSFLAIYMYPPSQALQTVVSAPSPEIASTTAEEAVDSRVEMFRQMGFTVGGVEEAKEAARRAEAAQPNEAWFDEVVNRLVSLYQAHPEGFAADSLEAGELKRIGEMVNQRGGIDLMRAAHTEFVRRCNIRGAARNLEFRWDGIGSWRG